MTKAEFLEKLRIELSSGVTPQVLQENLNYYGQYIDDEIRKGRTESEVLAELGDPWILAKTIVDAQREESIEDVIYDSDGRTYRGNSSTEESSNIHVWSLDSWWKRLLLILVVVAVIVVIFAVISGIVSFDVVLKPGMGQEREGVLAAHHACDEFIQIFREQMKKFRGDLCTERHEYHDVVRPGKKRVLIVKQVAGQGAMYDTSLFAKEPSGTENGRSIIDMGNMPVIVTPNEYRDGIIRSMQ